MERVELHLHTNMCPMYEVTNIEGCIKKAKQCGMKGLSITDYRKSTGISRSSKVFRKDK